MKLIDLRCTVTAKAEPPQSVGRSLFWRAEEMEPVKTPKEMQPQGRLNYEARTSNPLRLELPWMCQFLFPAQYEM